MSDYKTKVTERDEYNDRDNSVDGFDSYERESNNTNTNDNRSFKASADSNHIHGPLVTISLWPIFWTAVLVVGYLVWINAQ